MNIKCPVAPGVFNKDIPIIIQVDEVLPSQSIKPGNTLMSTWDHHGER